MTHETSMNRINVTQEGDSGIDIIPVIVKTEEIRRAMGGVAGGEFIEHAPRYEVTTHEGAGNSIVFEDLATGDIVSQTKPFSTGAREIDRHDGTFDEEVAAASADKHDLDLAA